MMRLFAALLLRTVLCRAEALASMTMAELDAEEREPDR